MEEAGFGKVQLPHKTPTPSSSAMQITTCSDASGRSVTFSSKKFHATALAGLLPIAHIARSLNLFKAAKEVLSDAVPSKRNTLYSPELMFEQRLLALAAGYEDLNDHDELFHDLGFTSALGTANMASSATLCRFEKGFDRHSINALNETLLSAFIDADRRLGLLPRIRRKKYRCLFLDVDSTYIKLYGNQEKKSYNGHYQCCCLAPVLCYLHGYPIAVYGAAGTSDARKVLEHYLPRLLKRIQKAFPDYIIVLRADSGFNSNALIETCQKLGAHYIMGFPPIKAAQQAIYSKGLKYAKRKQAKRYTTAGTAAQIIGATDWNAKSWNQPRRVIARKRFDRRTCQLDLRLIQTSIACTKDSAKEGYAGELSLITISDMYEKVYCGRSRMQQWVGEFKTQCFGDRASATKFHANCYRMILAAYCQMLLKIARRLQYFGVRKANRKATQKTVRTFRRDVICVTAAVREMRKKLHLTLPEHLHDRQAFEALFSIRI